MALDNILKRRRNQNITKGLKYKEKDTIQNPKLKKLLNWLIRDPVKPKDETLPIAKNYQAWNQGNVVFLAGGRFRYVKSRPISFLSGFIVTLPGILFCIFE